MAPRALLIIENTWQEWLGNESCYACSMAAHQIWEMMGIPEKMGVSQVGSSQHCGWSGAQQPEVTAYVEKYLVGDAGADTNILETDGDYDFDEETWLGWQVPALE